MDERLAGGVAAFVAFLLYLTTLAPTVLPYRYPEMRDSAMIQARVSLLTIPDYTGYPTYAMLSHLFTYLPFGDPAYRINLASAAYAAVAVFLVYLICHRLTKRVVPSVAAALLFGTSQTFWSQAVIAEVYTLNALFISLTVLILLVWRDERKDRYLLLSAFLMGLSLTHHLTSGLLVPAAALFVLLVNWRKLLEWRLVLGGVGLFLLGLTPYLYLPIRASMDPPLNGADPTNFERFWELVRGGDYGDVMFAFGPAELPGRVGYYLADLSGQFHPALLPALLAAALVGAALMLRKDRPTLALLGVLYLGWLVYALEYDIGDVYYYFIPTYLILCVWASVGLAALLRAAARKSAAPVSKVIVVAAVLAVPLPGILANHGAVDRSEDYEGRRQVEAVAANAKPDATILQRRSPLTYMQFVEGRRRDLKLAASPYRNLEGEMLGIERAGDFLRSGRVYILDPTELIARSYDEAGYRLVPVERGVLYEVVREGSG